MWWPWGQQHRKILVDVIHFKRILKEISSLTYVIIFPQLKSLPCIVSELLTCKDLLVHPWPLERRAILRLVMSNRTDWSLQGVSEWLCYFICTLFTLKGLVAVYNSNRLYGLQYEGSKIKSSKITLLWWIIILYILWHMFVEYWVKQKVSLWRKLILKTQFCSKLWSISHYTK